MHKMLTNTQNGVLINGNRSPDGILQPPHARFMIPMLCRGQGDTYTGVLSDINIFFTAVYLAEAVLKNTAFGPWKYIKDNW